MVFKPEAESEPKAEPEPKSQHEPKAESELKSQPEPKAEPEAEPEPKAQPEPETEPEPRASTTPYSSGAEFILEETTTTTTITTTTTTTRTANDEARSWLNRQGRGNQFFGTNIGRETLKRKAEAERAEKNREEAEKVAGTLGEDGRDFFHTKSRLSSAWRSRPGQFSLIRKQKNLEISPFMIKAEKDLVTARTKDQSVDEATKSEEESGVKPVTDDMLTQVELLVEEMFATELAERAALEEIGDNLAQHRLNLEKMMAEARRQAHEEVNSRDKVTEVRDVKNVQQLVEEVVEIKPQIHERVGKATKEEVSHGPRYQEEDDVVVMSEALRQAHLDVRPIDMEQLLKEVFEEELDANSKIQGEDDQVMAEALRQAHLDVRPIDMEQLLKRVFEVELDANDRVGERDDGKVLHHPKIQGEDEKVMAEAMRQAHVNIRHIDLATESTEDMVMKVLEDVMVNKQHPAVILSTVESIEKEEASREEAARPSGSGVIQAFRVEGDTRNQLIFMDLQVLEDAGIHLDRAGITLGFAFGDMVLIPVRIRILMNLFFLLSKLDLPFKYLCCYNIFQVEGLQTTSPDFSEVLNQKLEEETVQGLNSAATRFQPNPSSIFPNRQPNPSSIFPNRQPALPSILPNRQPALSSIFPNRQPVLSSIFPNRQPALPSPSTSIFPNRQPALPSSSLPVRQAPSSSLPERPVPSSSLSSSQSPSGIQAGIPALSRLQAARPALSRLAASSPSPSGFPASSPSPSSSPASSSRSPEPSSLLLGNPASSSSLPGSSAPTSPNLRNPSPPRLSQGIVFFKRNNHQKDSRVQKPAAAPRASFFHNSFSHFPPIEPSSSFDQFSSSQLGTFSPQFDTPFPQLQNPFPQLKTSSPQLETSSPQLKTSSPQLKSSPPKLESSSSPIQELMALAEALRAAPVKLMITSTPVQTPVQVTVTNSLLSWSLPMSLSSHYVLLHVRVAICRATYRKT